MLDEGFPEDQIEIQRTADIRFQGQEYELTLPMPARPLTEDDAEKIFEEYHALYERTYGEGTAWKGVPASMINYSVTVVGRQPRPDLDLDRLGAGQAGGHREGAARPSSCRPSAGTRRSRSTTTRRFTSGTPIEGPAIIDAADTTIYVPPGTKAERDEYMNYVLTR